MRRRRPEQAHVVIPSWMTSPSPADFPDGSCHWQCAWWEAYNEWTEQHPDADLDAVHAPDGGWHPELL